MNAQATKRTTKINQRQGFTIVELLVVVVLIAVLAAITVVGYNGISARATAASLQSDLSNAAKKLKMYQVDYGSYPTSIDTSTYCPTPVDANYCLKAGAGNTFSNYTVDNAASPQTFSLDATSANGIKYYVSESVPASSSSGTFTMASISGTARTGSVLTAGTLTPTGATVNRQWRRSTTAAGTYTDITGATNSTYTVPAGDIGYYRKVVASGTGSYSGTVTSAATAKITTLVTAVGAITGTPKVGSVLTAGARTPSAATVSYQWKANGVNIAGATASTFTLTSTQLGTTITVTVTGTGNYSGSATSAATAAVS